MATFSEFYRQYLANKDRFGDDEVFTSHGDAAWNTYTTTQLVDALVAGKAGVGEAGPELERRGALDQVPGNTWD